VREGKVKVETVRDDALVALRDPQHARGLGEVPALTLDPVLPG
jgi:hypothetical protein